jgi:hypothetical protein
MFVMTSRRSPQLHSWAGCAYRPARAGKARSTPISRILSRANAGVFIYLGRSLPNGSLRCSSFGRAGRRADAMSERSCFRWGLPATASPRIAVSSYLTISPLRVWRFAPNSHPSGGCRRHPVAPFPASGGFLRQPEEGGLFLWHFPSSRPDRMLSCTLPDEARTFLEQRLPAKTQRTPRAGSYHMAVRTQSARRRDARVKGNLRCGAALAAWQRIAPPMQTRRTFFGASAVALTATQVLATRTAVAGSTFDLAAIEACLDLPFRHRQAFGSYRLADGAAAAFMLNSLNAYEFDYGDGPGTLHALGIFYGTAVAMLLDDAAWRRYKLDVLQQRRGDPAKRQVDDGGNPYLRPRSSLDRASARADLHGFYHDASLTALAKRQASFLACDNALSGLATDIAVTYGIADVPVQTVHADLRAHLFPGTLLVPAGVAAVNQAQEMKFTFIPASL